MSTLIMGLVLVSCSNDEDTDLVGNWVKKKVIFDGPARLRYKLVIGKLCLCSDRLHIRKRRTKNAQRIPTTFLSL
jgi:hypothetical protein